MMRAVNGSHDHADRPINARRPAGQDEAPRDSETSAGEHGSTLANAESEVNSNQKESPAREKVLAALRDAEALSRDPNVSRTASRLSRCGWSGQNKSQLKNKSKSSAKVKKIHWECGLQWCVHCAMNVHVSVALDAFSALANRPCWCVTIASPTMKSSGETLGKVSKGCRKKELPIAWVRRPSDSEPGKVVASVLLFSSQEMDDRNIETLQNIVAKSSASIVGEPTQVNEGELVGLITEWIGRIPSWATEFEVLPGQLKEWKHNHKCGVSSAAKALVDEPAHERYEENCDGACAQDNEHEEPTEVVVTTDLGVMKRSQRNEYSVRRSLAALAAAATMESQGEEHLYIHSTANAKQDDEGFISVKVCTKKDAVNLRDELRGELRLLRQVQFAKRTAEIWQE